MYRNKFVGVLLLLSLLSIPFVAANTAVLVMSDKGASQLHSFKEGDRNSVRKHEFVLFREDYLRSLETYRHAAFKYWERKCGQNEKYCANLERVKTWSKVYGSNEAECVYLGPYTYCG